MARRLVFAATASALALLVMTLFPATASAHAVLLETTPGNWQVVESAPHEISLRFNEPVDLGLAEIRVLGPHGDAVEGLSSPKHPDERREVVSVAVPGTLATGTHTVTYRVVSADSHPVQGAFSFSVGEPTSTTAASAPAALDAGNGLTASVYGVVRWAGYAGLAILLGTASLVALCWQGGATWTGTRRLIRTGWAVVVSATVLSLFVYGPYAAGRPLSAAADVALLTSTLGSRMGLMLGIRLLLLAAVAAGLAWLPRGNPVLRGGFVLGAGGALALTWSLATHSAAGEYVVLALVSDTAHLTAMSVWIGGLVALAVVLLRTDDVAGMSVAVPRFSRIAAVCVAVLVVTGIFQAWRQIGTPASLFGTTYGTILIVKLALVAVLVALGGLARRWVRRHYGEPVVTAVQRRRARRGPGEPELRRFRRSIGVEAGVAALVLGFTAVLVSVEPAQAEVAREREAAQVPAYTGPVSKVLPFDAGGAAGRGGLAVEVTPGRIGPNEVHLSVLDLAAQPREVPEVRAELRLPDRSVGPLPVQLQAAGPGHYIATGATITMPGQWELDLFVRTSEVDQAMVSVPVGIR